MAVRYFGIERGQQQSDIVDSGTSNGTKIELMVDLADINAVSPISKHELINALDMFKAYILRSTYPAS